MDSLPYEIRNGIIQCFGTAFHYKDTMETFLRACGVDRELAARHKDRPKFVWARLMLADLDDRPNGCDLQRRILTELCKLRSLPDKDVPNPDAGLNALREIKRYAIEHDLFAQAEVGVSASRKAAAEERAKLLQERQELLADLKQRFLKGTVSVDRQDAGYSLEDILQKLFPLFEIDYRKSYRTKTQQIDGHFRFEGFDYLVEAKWRTDQPTEGEIGGFKRKVDTKFESTRGVFVSINGYREEVVEQFSGAHSKILFFTGEDLIHILEGRIDLREALRIKIEKAAQEGRVLISVSSMLA